MHLTSTVRRLRSLCLGLLLASPALLAQDGTVPLNLPGVQAALQHAKEHHAENIEKQIAISQTPASPFGEAGRGKFISSEFKRIGLTDVETDPVGNVLGWRRGTSGRTLVLAAHLDTVFPPTTDFTVKHDGTRLNGPGIQDDSRGLAVLIATVEALQAGQLKTRDNLLFVANVGEEGIGNLRGTKYLFGEGKYKDQLVAFISVDADGVRTIANREIGSRRYLITVKGPGGHSWGNFGRPNPANALGRIIAELANLDVPSNPETNRTSYNVGRIGGGTSVNSIPFEAWFEFDMRSMSEDEVIALEKKFLAIVDHGVELENQFARQHGKGIFAKGELTVEKKMIGLRHAVTNPVNADLAAAAAASIRELGFGEPQLVPGSTDANAVASLGKPAITLGGGGVAANTHSLNEWFEPKDAYQGVQLLIMTILHFDRADAAAK